MGKKFGELPQANPQFFDIFAFESASGLTKQNYISNIPVEGDVQGKLSAIILKTTGVTAGIYGSTTQIPSLTIDSKGRITLASTVNISINTLLPSQTGNSGKYLKTNGTSVSWASASVGAGTVSNVSGVSDRIDVINPTTTPTIDISSTYIGQSSITNVGTITTGIWNGTSIVDAYISSSSTWNALVSNATHTGDVTGATTLTLATVNSNIGTFNNVTVNGKGLVTAASNVSYQTTLGYTPINKSGDSSVSDLTFLTNTGIDSVSSGILNVGSTNALTVNLGTSSSNTSVNIGTTGTNAINIGNSNSTVNISGSVVNVQTVNGYVTDKLFTLNKGGGVASATGTGIEFEENSTITGYVKTNGGRDGFLFKAPSNSFDSSFLFSPTTARNYTFPDLSGTIALTSQIPSLIPATLSKTDDTNVTLTLGGTPSTALLQAVSLTLGWTGTLADSRIASASNWNSKEPAITTGTTSQYWRGDKSFQTLDKTAVGLGNVDNTSDANKPISTATQTSLNNKQPLDGDLTAIAALSTNGFAKRTGTDTWVIDTNTYLTTNQSITLSGDVTGSGTTAITASISNSTVTSKLITGYVSGAGTVVGTDSILQAIQKLNGNIASLVTGVSSVSGTTNRITSSGGTSPSIDISSSYVGQSSITILGTVTTGIWNGTVIGDSYISSASTWNAKESTLTFSTGLTRSVNTITVNTSQNITTLSNLTTAGVVKTNASGLLSSALLLDTDITTGTIANNKLANSAVANLSGTNTGDNAINSLYSGLAASKQDTLISATNIKTVNGSSILGSGDLAVSSSITTITATLTFTFLSEEDTVINTISNALLTTSNFKSFSYICIETTDTSLDDFKLNGVSFNIEEIVDNTSFKIRANATNNATGVYTIIYKIIYQ